MMKQQKESPQNKGKNIKQKQHQWENLNNLKKIEIIQKEEIEEKIVQAKKSQSNQIQNTYTNIIDQPKVILKEQSSKKLIENVKPIVVDAQKVDDLIEQVENFEEIINDFKQAHEKIVEDVDDIKKKDQAKATEKNLAYYFEKLANGLQKELGERPPYNPQKMNEENDFQKRFQSEDSIRLNQAFENLLMKFEIVGLHIIDLKKFKSKSQKQIYNLEQQSEKFIKLDQFREEFQNHEQKINDFVNQQVRNLQEDFQKCQQNISLNEIKFDQELGEVKKETIWKIKQCEELLEERISKQNLQDSIISLNKKLTGSIEFVDKKLEDKLSKSINDIELQLSTIKSVNDQKFQHNRVNFDRINNYIEQNCSKKIHVQEIEQQLTNLKFQFEDQGEIISRNVKDQKEKIQELFKKLQLIQEKIQNVEQDQKNMPEKSPDKASDLSIINQGNSDYKINNNLNLGRRLSSFTPIIGRDNIINQSQEINDKKNKQDGSPSPNQKQKKNHIIELLEVKIKQIEDFLPQFELHLNGLSSIFEEFAQKFSTKIQSLEDEKLSINKLNNYIPDFTDFRNQILTSCQNQLTDPIKIQIQDYIQFNDEKLQKIRREINIGSISSQMKEFIKKEEVYQIKDTSQRQIKDLDENFQLMITDFGIFQKAINQIHKNIIKLQEINRDVLIGKRNNNCISCGDRSIGNVNGIQSNNMSNDGADYNSLGKYEAIKHVKGQDGKLYISKNKMGYQSEDAQKLSQPRKIVHGLASQAGYKKIESIINDKQKEQINEHIKKRQVEKIIQQEENMLLNQGLLGFRGDIDNFNQEILNNMYPESIQETQFSLIQQDLQKRSTTVLQNQSKKNIVKLMSRRGSNNMSVQKDNFDQQSRAYHSKRKLPLSFIVQNQMRNQISLKKESDFGHIEQSQNLNRHSTSGASNKFNNFHKFGGRTSSMGENEKMINKAKLNEFENQIKSQLENNQDQQSYAGLNSGQQDNIAKRPFTSQIQSKFGGMNANGNNIFTGINSLNNSQIINNRDTINLKKSPSDSQYINQQIF